MSQYGLILLVESDEREVNTFTQLLRELQVQNEVIWFDHTMAAFSFLKTTERNVFLIFCNADLHKRIGIAFKRDIDSDPELRKKSIPFIFYSTEVNQEDINEAYTEMTVQGFFKKENTHAEMKKVLQVIFNYWKICMHPNTI